jgi:hypothetical protein
MGKKRFPSFKSMVYKYSGNRLMNECVITQLRVHVCQTLPPVVNETDHATFFSDDGAV